MKIHKLNLLLNLLFQNLIREIENRPLNSIELRNALNTVIQLGNEASSFSGAVTNMCTLFSRYVSIFYAMKCLKFRQIEYANLFAVFMFCTMLMCLAAI